MTQHDDDWLDPPPRKSRGRARGPRTPGEQALAALKKAGGVKFFSELAKESPKEFASLLARFKLPGDVGEGASVVYKAVPIPVECRDQMPELLAQADGPSLAVCERCAALATRAE